MSLSVNAAGRCPMDDRPDRPDAGVSHAVILGRDLWGQTETALRTAGWQLEQLRPAAPEGYHVFALTPPEASQPAGGSLAPND